jgi:hypothetical protein
MSELIRLFLNWRAPSRSAQVHVGDTIVCGSRSLKADAASSGVRGTVIAQRNAACVKPSRFAECHTALGRAYVPNSFPRVDHIQ